MTLLIAMLPLYLLGNFHCVGMCGPLVMMLGKNKYRYFYFLGRTLSFTTVGALSGGIGAFLHQILSRYHLSALLSISLGGLMVVMGLTTLLGRQMPLNSYMANRFKGIHQRISELLLKDSPVTTFAFGFLTIALPCGQTIVVFSACALFGSVFIGLINGLAFALITSPALFFAMHAQKLFQRFKNQFHPLMGGLAMMVGSLAICRGLAEIEWIHHWIIHPNSLNRIHIVMF